jgi:hypothetical protein
MAIIPIQSSSNVQAERRIERARENRAEQQDRREAAKQQDAQRLEAQRARTEENKPNRPGSRIDTTA